MDDDESAARQALEKALTQKIVAQLEVYERLAGYDAFEIMDGLIAAGYGQILERPHFPVLEYFTDTKALIEGYLKRDNDFVRACALENEARKRTAQESGSQ